MWKKLVENFLRKELGTVSFQELNIVDIKGNRRATLGTKNHGSIALELFQQNGRPRLIMETSENGEPSVKLLGPPSNDDKEDAVASLELVVHNDGVMAISLIFKNQNTIELIVEEGEDPAIIMSTAERKITNIQLTSKDNN